MRLGWIISQLVAAWKLPAVRRGCFGAALLFLGSLTPAYLPQTSPWWGPLRGLGWDNWEARVVGTGMVVSGCVLLIHAWILLRPTFEVRIRYWAVGVLWAIPLLFAPPIFSHDAYGYAAEGWLLHNGLNPYDFAVSTQPGPFADQVAWQWRFETSMYPPLSLQIFHGIVLLGGLNPYISALMMRVPAVLGVCLIAYFLPRIATRLKMDARKISWFAIINPVLLVDLVGGAHNDALMVGLVVLALWLAVTGPDWIPTKLRQVSWLTKVSCFAIPALLIGVAACVKQPALLAALAVPLLGHPIRTLHWKALGPGFLRLITSLALAIIAFVLVTFACGLGFGWIKATAVPGSVVTLAPVSWIGNGLQALLVLAGQPGAGELALKVTRIIGTIVFVLVTIILGLRVGRTRPIKFLSWSYLVFAFTVMAMHPWYLTWGGVLFPMTRPSRRAENVAIIGTIALLAYGAGNLAWRNEALPMGLGTAALVAILLFRNYNRWLTWSRSTRRRDQLENEP